MKRSTLGALLIVVLAGLAIGAYKMLQPTLDEQERIQSSDSTHLRQIRIGGDGYLGYWFITSPQMRVTAPKAGLRVDFTDDGGAYADRLRKFANDEYDAIVLPVSSYLQHGARHNFPGVIVAALAESKGADGIVGLAERFPTGKISDLNDSSLQIVYTAESPSSFLLDLTIVDFDLFHLRSTDRWRVEVDGSEKVYERAKSKSGDAFVMWEPELSKALNETPNLTYLWGSDGFGGYIIDVLVFRRQFVDKYPDAVLSFLDTYFATLRSYNTNRSRLLKEMKTSAQLRPEVAERMLKKIDWYDLHENASRHFGLTTRVDTPATEGMANCIIACTDVLVRTGAMDQDPLGDPYLIIKSTFLEQLVDRVPSRVGSSRGPTIDYPMLSNAEWDSLREIGTMRVEPITFQSGRNLLDDAGKAQVDKIATMLVNIYYDYRVAVRGHTGPGDAAANQQLSFERAEVVVQRLVAVHNIDRERLQPVGRGSLHPPPRKPGETPRAFRYRLPRVEFVLLEDNSL